MKIHLERKLSSCPDRMTCTVCHESFWTREIRTLLYSDNNLIQGDVCPECTQLSAAKFQQKLRNQANRFVQEAFAHPERYDAFHTRAVELLETSEEKIKFPTFLHWLVKKIQIFSEESRELEVTRLGLDRYGYEGRSQSLGQKSP
jgi:predicted amidophosphoribosyltransferase